MSSDAIPTEVIHHQYGWQQRNDKANWQHSNKETSDTQHSIVLKMSYKTLAMYLSVCGQI
jgi:hypothetical protein